MFVRVGDLPRRFDIGQAALASVWREHRAHAQGPRGNRLHIDVFLPSPLTRTCWGSAVRSLPHFGGDSD